MTNSNTQVQAVNTTPQIKEFFKPEVLDVIKNTFCKDATDAEFLLFAHKAAAYRLDPFKNEIFFIKYGNTARIQFAEEAYLSKAREKEGFQAPDTQMVCANDEFQIAKNAETKEMEVVKHEISFPRGSIIGAYSIAYRDGYRPVTVIMDREEIQHMFSGQNKENWNKWTTDMFGKHVEGRALKKQYGLEFGNDQIESQVQQMDAYQHPIDITPQPDEPKLIEDNIQRPDPEPSEVNPADAVRDEMKGLFKQLGIMSKEAMKDYIQKKGKFKSEQPTVAEMKGLIKIMKMEFEDMGSDLPI